MEHIAFTVQQTFGLYSELTGCWPIIFEPNETGSGGCLDMVVEDHYILTGRNEVLARVIFSEACVKNSVHRRGSPILGGLQIFGVSNFSGGFSNFLGGVSNFLGGSPNFWGVSNFSGGSLNLWGVSNFLGGPTFWGGFFLISAFFGDTPPPRTRHRNTVNVRPVRILLECILVFFLKLIVVNLINKTAYHIVIILQL